ncbi:MAG: transcriptional regulator [Hyphomicrobiaceae bacterium]|nr:transcriptional regulator [Hyphomicrobiaceae bacterium]
MTYISGSIRAALAGAGALVLAGLAIPVGAAELIMLEQGGCPWCERFNREIAPAYPLTPEGKRAPLRRVQLHAPLPADLKFLIKGNFTPTFVLIDKGREVGRIRGYPGDNFFWGMLDQLLAKLPPENDSNSKPTD